MKISKELARAVHKKAEELGGWDTHGIKIKISEELYISRPTLDALLEIYPKSPEDIYEEYKEFYEIPQIKDFLKIVCKGKTKLLRKCWSVLDYKNPMNWKSEDLAILREHPQLIDQKTELIQYSTLGVVRKFLSLNNPTLFAKEKTNLLSTKKTKRPKGTKREWFLTSNELNKFIEVIDDNDFLVPVTCQVKWGCRHSALINKNMTVSQIQELPNNEDNIVAIAYVLEPKTGKTWTKWIDRGTHKLLKDYIQLKNLKSDDGLFKHSLAWYNIMMKEYGMKAGLCKYEKIRKRSRRLKYKFISGIPMSSHILRHTFAWKCSNLGFSLEETADLGGWDDVNTLKDFYFYVPSERLRKRYASIDWSKDSQNKMELIESRKEPLSEDELKEIEGEQ